MILRLVNGAIRRVRATYYSFMGVHIEGHCWLQRIEVPQNYRSLRIKEGAAIDRNVTLLVTGASRDRVRISIGNSVYINRHTMIDASESIAIERDCMIGPFCYITDHDHGTDQGISVKDQPLVSAAVTIEKEAWIRGISPGFVRCLGCTCAAAAARARLRRLARGPWAEGDGAAAPRC